MTSRVEIEELISVLEDIRSSQHPDVPAELIRNIVYAEFEKQDDRAQGRKEVKKLVDDFLKTIAEA
ncbi:hypothetical protein CE91St44_00930 [Oscillospiraceae bacterium]|nr:hypothetical protein CE91St44_00930 [Oscillospiraceae bacterium]